MMLCAGSSTKRRDRWKPWCGGWSARSSSGGAGSLGEFVGRGLPDSPGIGWPSGRLSGRSGGGAFTTMSSARMMRSSGRPGTSWRTRCGRVSCATRGTIPSRESSWTPDVGAALHVPPAHDAETQREAREVPPLRHLQPGTGRGTDWDARGAHWCRRPWGGPLRVATKGPVWPGNRLGRITAWGRRPLDL